MSDTSTLTLTDFLLARIAEDEEERNVDLRPWAFDYTAADKAEAHRWKAECEAKRRIVRLHPEILTICQGCANESYPCRTLLALALPYADHPDYREEWRP